MSVFDTSEKKPHTKRNMFLDGSVDIQRFDIMKYPEFQELTERGLSFFWRPSEVDVSKDAKDYKELPEHEKRIFVSNLKRQILLDSVQGRAPVEAFLPYVSLPEVENFTNYWAAYESCIHSFSYTHLLRGVLHSSEAAKIFDTVTDIEDIVVCANTISKDYDAVIEYGKWYDLLGEGEHEINGRKMTVSKYEMKRLLWRAIHVANCLEGIRFYSSFCTGWVFAEHKKKMEGNAKIIKLICRDENLHLAATQLMLKLLPKEDPDFAKIQDEERDYVTKMFVETTEQEKTWADYLFEDGSMVGLNEKILKDYLEYLATKRMRRVELESPYSVPANDPLPWTQKWISGQEVQVAPQETELDKYQISEVKQDANTDAFKKTLKEFQL